MYFRKAKKSDTAAIKKLLITQALPVKDIENFIDNFIVIIRNDKIIGSVGLEIYGEKALLRSLVVEPEFQRQRLGVQLIDEIIKKARLSRITDLYLLTETAEDFFIKLNFIKIDRESVDPRINQCAEFTECCPCSAICMTINIET